MDPLRTFINGIRLQILLAPIWHRVRAADSGYRSINTARKFRQSNPGIELTLLNSTSSHADTVRRGAYTERTQMRRKIANWCGSSMQRNNIDAVNIGLERDRREFWVLDTVVPQTRVLQT
ncbi:hypothetical protein B0H11DRAFT_1922744 [Mycena galericulata]|nr:hypothetical protein B0H11DRAFT_1922744 [Mycena galericulata]